MNKDVATNVDNQEQILTMNHGDKTKKNGDTWVMNGDRCACSKKDIWKRYMGYNGDIMCI